MYEPAEARRVAGITVPAFVERSCAPTSTPGRPAGVAGITVPAFVERLPLLDHGRQIVLLRRVAGIAVPAFVERLRSAASRRRSRVSPELGLWPSLNGVGRHRH